MTFPAMHACMQRRDRERKMCQGTRVGQLIGCSQKPPKEIHAYTLRQRQRRHESRCNWTVTNVPVRTGTLKMTSRSSSARPLTNQKGYITLPTKLANYDQNAPQRKCSEPSIYRMMARAQQPLLSLNTLPSLEFFLCCRHPSLQRCHCYRRCCSKL